MKKWKLTFNKSFKKRLAKLPRGERERISNAMDALEFGPYQCGLDVKRLVGQPEWRLRVGRWRILFLVENETITILVVGLDTRGDVYK